MKDISQIVASNVMHSPVYCARPDDTLKKLEDTFDDKHISGMPVVENGEMIGIITQDDLIRVPAMMDAMARYVTSEMQSDGPMMDTEDKDNDGVPDSFDFRGQIPNMKVSQVMARKVVTCELSTPLERIIELMVQHHIHRVVVIDGSGPVGIISTLDVLKNLADS